MVSVQLCMNTLGGGSGKLRHRTGSYQDEDMCCRHASVTTAPNIPSGNCEEVTRLWGGTDMRRDIPLHSPVWF